jgi:hypothetical protein
LYILIKVPKIIVKEIEKAKILPTLVCVLLFCFLASAIKRKQKTTKKRVTPLHVEERKE